MIVALDRHQVSESSGEFSRRQSNSLIVCLDDEEILDPDHLVVSAPSTKESPVDDGSSVRPVEEVQADEIKIRGLLGSGTFSDAFLADRVDSSSRTSSLALKKLHMQMLKNDKAIEVAVNDLTHEVRVLSRIPNHENIVNLEAISHGFWEEPKEGFLLLELLVETLHERMFRWKTSSNFMKENRSISFLTRRSQRASLERQEQRCRIRQAGLGIAKALEFLHEHKIIYRDLKPKNVGFNKAGQVKLFDFGLARIVDVNDPDRRLTGAAGTARYMAPECATSERYEFPADVYSFAITLWEICTLEKPFAKAKSIDSLHKMTISAKTRPSLRKVASKDAKEILKACWDPEPRARPTIGLVRWQLDQLCSK